MPLGLQARLLRVLQEREVQPLGGGKPVPVDFRLVCATHRDLRGLMAAGRFREDLYYRINGLALQLPPLRERQDRAELVARIVAESVPDRPIAFTPEIRAAMLRYAWPGNLRQLANALRTACVLLDDAESVIDWHHLPDDLAGDLRRDGPGRVVLDEDADLRASAGRTVQQVVKASGGNLSEAARRLGISRNTLYRKLGEQGARG
jgi:transcriptional regulator of acetoin/glycerol metabolism